MSSDYSTSKPFKVTISLQDDTTIVIEDATSQYESDNYSIVKTPTGLYKYNVDVVKCVRIEGIEITNKY